MKKILLAGLAGFLIFHFSVFAYAVDRSREIDRILSSADSLFKAMQSRNYGRIWQLLSDTSKDRIVESTLKSIEKSGGEKLSEQQVRENFSQGGAIARAYWDGYMRYFDPEKVLEESRWQMGPVESSRAEILITYRSSQYPAKVKMINENGSWKVGLIETFGSHK
jgi:hypothetical protein